MDKPNTDGKNKITDKKRVMSKRVRKAKRINPVLKNILKGIGIGIVLTFLKPIIVPINYVILIFLIFTGLGFLGTFLSANKVKATKEQQTTIKKKAFFIGHW